MTAKYAQILAAIQRLTKERKEPPTHKELGEAVSHGRKWMEIILQRMRRDGLVEWEYGVPRTLRVVDPGDPGSRVGRVK